MREVTTTPAPLQPSATALMRRYDVALLDLDGVVYVGGGAVAHAAPSLSAARDAGMRLAFVTNNAARTPESVAAHLVDLGIAATTCEIITSAQAAAHHLARLLPPGAQVLVVGTTGLVEALRERGLSPVDRDDSTVVAVVQGFSPELTWRQLSEGMLAIGRGVPWVATNLDRTVPSPRGQLPGNGAMVAALRHATGAEPVSTGKPDPRMHAECIERTAARSPLVVGDRLDTDIEGANAVGCASLLVLTGVTSPSGLLHAGAHLRPTYLAADLRGLLEPHPATDATTHGARCGIWCAEADAGTVVLRARTGADGQAAGSDPGAAARERDLDALRALCAAVWQRPDAPQRWRVRGDGTPAAEALRHLGLDS